MESGKLDEELSRMNEIVEKIRPNSILLSNESFASTNEREGSEIADQIVRASLARDVKVFFVTHLYHFAGGSLLDKFSICDKKIVEKLDSMDRAAQVLVRAIEQEHPRQQLA